MIDNENVVQLPTLLQRLASKLQTCLTQESTNRQEWIAVQEAKCATLIEIRDQFVADIEFGQWCNENGFGKDVLNPATRAAAIAMGRLPAALHRCLEATSRRSLDTIHRLEFPGFCNVTKPTRRRQEIEKSGTPLNVSEDLAAEIINRFFERGENSLDITHALINPAAKRQSLAVEKIVAIERGRRQGLAEQLEPPPLDPADMREHLRKRYEATVRKARKELRDEITAEVSAEYQIMLDGYRQRVANADRIEASHRGVMSREAFRKIKACLHPDHNTFTFAAEALQIFSELEKVLVKPETRSSMVTGPGALPKTVAEMMARRRAR